ncbi:MAG: flagellar export protein FliJ [Hydrogenovibrio sp.]
MALSKLERLQVLVDLAQDELDKAQDVFVTVQGQRDGVQAQLNSLVEYHADYIAQLSQARDITVTQLQTMQSFLDKVNNAIHSQKQQLQQLEGVVEKAHEAWLEKRLRHKSLQKLHEKMQKDQRVKLDKQEQKMLDELASQTFVQRSKSGDDSV